MTREQLKDAVVEAARSAIYAAPGAYERLSEALAALDAHTAQEVVTLAVWRAPTGAVSLYEPGTVGDKPTPGWIRLATVTLPLDREGGE